MKKTRRAGERREKRRPIHPVLHDFAKKLSDCRTLRSGAIAIRASGPGGGDYHFDCAKRRARIIEGMPSGDPPLLEITGNARQIQGILAGRKDARTHFLAGAFRVRGDISYLSEIGMELGILKRPL